MKRSLVAHALLPALLLQLLLPAAGWAEPGRDRDAETAPKINDKETPRPRRGPIQRLTDKESARPGSGRIPRLDEAPAEPGERDGMRRFRYRAANDFLIEVLAWPARGGGFTAAATLTDARGERMSFEIAPDAGFGPTVLIDGAIVVSYDVARDGSLHALTVHDGDRAVTSLRARGGDSTDRDAYLHLVESVTARHSADFLREMKVAMHSFREDAIAAASLRDIFECVLGITGYVVSIWGIIAGCTIAGMPTLGASCVFAILAHEVAAASAILGCFPD